MRCAVLWNAVWYSSQLWLFALMRLINGIVVRCDVNCCLMLLSHDLYEICSAVKDGDIFFRYHDSFDVARWWHTAIPLTKCMKCGLSSDAVFYVVMLRPVIWGSLMIWSDLGASAPLLNPHSPTLLTVLQCSVTLCCRVLSFAIMRCEILCFQMSLAFIGKTASRIGDAML